VLLEEVAPEGLLACAAWNQKKKEGNHRNVSEHRGGD